LGRKAGLTELSKANTRPVQRLEESEELVTTVALFLHIAVISEPQTIDLHEASNVM